MSSPADVRAPAAAPNGVVPLSMQRRIGVLGVTVAASISTYTVVNLAVASARVDRTLATSIDAFVPFDAAGIIPYGGIYAIALTPACLITDRRLLDRCALGFAVLLLCALPVWVLWPVTVPRTPSTGDGLLDWGVALMRWLDPPMNCLPSMHVGETILAAYFCGRMDRRAGLGVGVLAAAVWWSTMALDQHWFLDGLAGAILAVVVGSTVLAVRPLPAAAFTPAPRRHLLWALALYAVMFAGVSMPWWLGWATAEQLRAMTP